MSEETLTSAPDVFCSDVQVESLPGTAKPGSTYVLFEWPHAWTHDVLDGGTLGEELTEKLKAHLAEYDASLLLIPGYTGAVIVGALSGKIGKFLPTRPAIFTALASITIALLILAVGMEASPWVFMLSSLLFACGFALLYAPLVATAIGNIPAAKSGIAIGFYNLTINVAVPLGIAYSAKLVDLGLGVPGFPVSYTHLTLPTTPYV